MKNICASTFESNKVQPGLAWPSLVLVIFLNHSTQSQNTHIVEFGERMTYDNNN